MRLTAGGTPRRRGANRPCAPRSESGRCMAAPAGGAPVSPPVATCTPADLDVWAECHRIRTGTEPSDTAVVLRPAVHARRFPPSSAISGTSRQSRRSRQGQGTPVITLRYGPDGPLHCPSHYVSIFPAAPVTSQAAGLGSTLRETMAPSSSPCHSGPAASPAFST